MRDSGSHIITSLRKKWSYKAIISQFLLALGLALLVYSFLHTFYGSQVYVLLLLLIVIVFFVHVIDKKAKITDADVARILNINKPILEESAGLFLKETSTLNFLEKFQLQKITSVIEKIEYPDPFRKRLITSALILLIFSTASFALMQLRVRSGSDTIARSDMKHKTSVALPEVALPEVGQARIIIIPPSYTNKTSRQQNTFNLLAEEGGIIIWDIQTTVRAKEVKLLFNDGSSLPLSKNAGNVNWRAQKQINRTGFYQLKIDDIVSEIYKIEIIKDQPPIIAIEQPQSNTNIPYGGAQAVLMLGRLSDDYGIKSTFISATVSSGQGEGVKFKEQKISVASFRPGQRQINVQQSISWKAMGMRPGDELYFYISAIDNRNQETRSQVYIVTLEDTANQTSMNGMVTPMDIQQELFRSQRQIIIETEQLLKNRSRITVEEFTNKSNNLGLDQKLLRMRYGKFLGEETDVAIGDEHEGEGEEAHTDDPQAIIDQYSHKHDVAEDASFFDAATKKQLKATLTEMWKAEMKLRTILPKDALPFEYKALALLKDLQQKSRVYVAKTGIKTTPLNLDKRLTGDLNKINQPTLQQKIEKPESPADALRAAFAILEELKANGKIDPSEKELLQKAFYQLSLKAADMPSVYIPSLSSLKKILSEKYRVADITRAQQGLQKMTAAAEKLPYRGHTSTMALSQQYINKLKLNRP